MPKITSKFPLEKMPKNGFLETYSLDKNGNFLNKKGGLLNDEYNFILTTEGLLKIGNRHHFLANAKNVVAAGNVYIKNGKVVKIDNLSGHYKPKTEETTRYVEVFQNLNFPIKRARLEIRTFREVGNGYIDPDTVYKTMEFKK